MAPQKKKLRKPAIIVSESDHKRLWLLAEQFAERNPDVAETIFAELDRARVVRDDRIAGTVVRMGSSLRFTTDLGEDRQVTLVYPRNADIAQGKISILTPIGAALIGLSTGQSIDWATRDGRVSRLTVEEVSPPQETPDAAGDARH